jgi:hypothetical protein
MLACKKDLVRPADASASVRGGNRQGSDLSAKGDFDPARLEFPKAVATRKDIDLLSAIDHSGREKTPERTRACHDNSTHHDVSCWPQSLSGNHSAKPTRQRLIDIQLKV